MPNINSTSVKSNVSFPSPPRKTQRDNITGVVEETNSTSASESLQSLQIDTKPATTKQTISASPYKMENDNFEFGIGGSGTGFSIFLAERTKKVHFIRHAEGSHNVASRNAGTDAVLVDNMDYWDAPLTEAGVEQCLDLRRHLANRPSQGRPFTHFDLVIVSPLTRTLQTAQHIFGPPRKPGVPSFLSPPFEDTSLPRPQILVREEARERWGYYSCDGRRNISEIMKEFPDFDFSAIEHDEDVFYTREREPTAHIKDRTIQFLEWLNKRPEKCIAVVTHSSFLRHLFMQFGGDQADTDKSILQRGTGNCELRSVVLCSHGVKDGRQLRKMTQTRANNGGLSLAGSSSNLSSMDKNRVSATSNTNSNSNSGKVEGEVEKESN